MKPYSPFSNKGRTISIDAIHHRSAGKSGPAPRAAAAKAMRHAARQEGRRQAASLVSPPNVEILPINFS